jgi:hypothetical protein
MNAPTMKAAKTFLYQELPKYRRGKGEGEMMLRHHYGVPARLLCYDAADEATEQVRRPLLPSPRNRFPNSRGAGGTPPPQLSENGRVMRQGSSGHNRARPLSALRFNYTCPHPRHVIIALGGVHVACDPAERCETAPSPPPDQADQLCA